MLRTSRLWLVMFSARAPGILYLDSPLHHTAKLVNTVQQRFEFYMQHKGLVLMTCRNRDIKLQLNVLVFKRLNISLSCCCDWVASVYLDCWLVRACSLPNKHQIKSKICQIISKIELTFLLVNPEQFNQEIATGSNGLSSHHIEQTYASYCRRL